MVDDEKILVPLALAHLSEVSEDTSNGGRHDEPSIVVLLHVRPGSLGNLAQTQDMGSMDMNMFFWVPRLS